MSNVIIALATAPIKSALAVIRISGEGSFEITEELTGKKIKGIDKRTSYYTKIKERENLIDEVVLLAYPNPHSMTGEDTIEIFSHGSMLIANQIIGAYLRKGARYASRGEFTMRAFLNGKMDLVEAEAVNDLINATSLESKNLSLMALDGETSKLLNPVKNDLGELLGLIEVNIDYSEYEDLEEITKEKIITKVGLILQNLNQLIENGEQGRIIKDGVKVALVGEPNVGKSSILNALLKEDKAIVSEIPGTTRDIVEGDISYKGVVIHLLDTAGIRESGDKIENLGIEKSRKAVDDSDIVIHIFDAAFPYEDGIEIPTGKTVIDVYNKDDLIKNKEDGKIYISAEKGEIMPLLEALYRELGLNENAFKNPSLSSVRQISLLKEAYDRMTDALTDAKKDAPIDLVSINLQAAYYKLQEILGELVNHDLSDEIFSRFCVGK